MFSYSSFLEENLDKKIEIFLNIVAEHLEKEKSVDNASFKMHNIFYKKAKNRFRNLYLNNYKDNYNICSKAEMSDDDLCIAVLKTGKNKGQLCNKSVYLDRYCKKHCKVDKEADEVYTNNKSRDLIEDTKGDTSGDTNDQKDIKVEIVNNKNNKIEESERTKIVIDINKFGNFVYGNTGLVFNNEKRIVAKEGVNGEWCTLKDEDVELCKKYKLRYQVINHDRKLPESTKTITKNFNILTNEWDD